jgi:hypothetical protein
MADGDAGEKSTEDGLYSEPLGEGDGCPSLAPDGGESDFKTGHQQK